MNFKSLLLKLQILPYWAKWAKFGPNVWPNRAAFFRFEFKFIQNFQKLSFSTNFKSLPLKLQIWANWA